MNRAICAFWVLTQTVSLPSAHRAAVARPSSGTGASRWFMMVALDDDVAAVEGRAVGRCPCGHGDV